MGQVREVSRDLMIACVMQRPRPDIVRLLLQHGADGEAIDKLKEVVPIWKKEFYEDGGEAKWKENPEFK